MKITILTLGDYNFGNRLQNYALTKVLEELSGAQVRTARIRDYNPVLNTFWLPLCFAKALVGSSKSAKKKRALKILSFTYRYIPTIQTRPERLIKNEDIVVVGSDQCWNPNWGVGARKDGAQCLIGKASNKKLSYAASFGVTEKDFPEAMRVRYGEWLKTFSSISVREDEAVKIVYDFSGVEAKLVLDPTMLLDVDSWESIERRPKNFSYSVNEYSLEFVLGKNADCLVGKCAQAISGPVFKLTNDVSEVGPSEFLWLIRNARSVVTDSFHASVFSLMFHKPLLVLPRKDHLGDMSTRFETLKRFSGFERCIVGDEEASFSPFEGMDWECFDSELEAYRLDSLKWLENALGKCL